MQKISSANKPDIVECIGGSGRSATLSVDTVAGNVLQWKDCSVPTIVDTKPNKGFSLDFLWFLKLVVVGDNLVSCETMAVNGLSSEEFRRALAARFFTQRAMPM